MTILTDEELEIARAEIVRTEFEKDDTSQKKAYFTLSMLMLI